MASKKKEIKEEPKDSKKETTGKKTIILCTIVVILLIVIGIVALVNAKKGNNSNSNPDAEEVPGIDFENVEVSTIKFKIKNSTTKNISKIYIRDNTSSNFSNELCNGIKDGEEKEIEYGNYSAVFIWDLKVVFEDGTEKTLNSLLAANVLYDGAAIELTELEDNVEAVNHEMVTFDENGEVISGETTEENVEETTEEETEVTEETEETEDENVEVETEEQETEATEEETVESEEE